MAAFILCTASCPVIGVRVHGSSMLGIADGGTTVDAMETACAPHIQMHDLVVFHSGASKEPLIKVIQGVAGDRFRLENDHLLINDRIIKTTAGAPFSFSPSRQKMLDLYVTSYKGIIPENTFLVLGNQKDGTMDSSQFGLVHKNDILYVVPGETLANKPWPDPDK